MDTKPSRGDRLEFRATDSRHVAFVDRVITDERGRGYYATVTVYRELSPGSMSFEKLRVVNVEVAPRGDDAPELFINLGVESTPADGSISSMAAELSAVFRTRFCG